MKMRAVNKSRLTTHKSITKPNGSKSDKIKGNSAYTLVFKGNKCVGLLMISELGSIGYFTVLYMVFQMRKLFSSGNE